jgi:hypothetical protein
MTSWRENRRIELRDIRKNDPVGLLAIYRRAMNLDGSQAIPVGQTFPTMIEAILDQEENANKPDGPPT